ncbi:MAG: type II secretion system protein [Pirellulales bacterium]
MNRRTQSGFTLIELLAVIVIISILVALISLAAVGAIAGAKQTVIAADINNLSQAMESMRATHFGGDYPPADLRVPGNGHMQQFVAKQWPRYNGNLANDLQARGIDTSKFQPDKALVFWLSGFSPDVSQPFTGPGRKPIMEFDADRLIDGRYLSTASGDDAQKPFLYFDYRAYGMANDYNVAPDATKKPNSFQIHSSGLDALYSTTGDNLTNYSGGKTLEELAEE